MINMFLIPTLTLVSVFFGFLVPIIKYKEETGPLSQSRRLTKISPTLKADRGLIPKNNVDDLDIEGAKMVVGSIGTSSVIAGYSATPFNNGVNITTLTEEFHRDTLNTGDQLWDWYVLKSTKETNNNG